MNRASLLPLLLLLTVAGASAAATAPARPVAASRRSAAGARAAHAPAPSPAPASRGLAAPRTLDDIHIEGEIPVPQVLFITARDQRRFLESQHRRYLPTSRELGAEAQVPSQVRVTRGSTRFEKEIGR